jgi:hypothetical protein
MPGTVLVTGVLLTAINSDPTDVSRLGSVGNIARNIGRAALGATAVGTATLAYAAGIERRHWTLRQATLPVLAEGARPLRVLHISDLHMTPNQKSKQRWVSALAELNPDLVVNTGDNLAHQNAVPGVLRALGPLLNVPGVFVFGSNDYYAPRPKNPVRYLIKSHKRVHGIPLPWRDLRAALIERGWHDLTHVRRLLTVQGQTIAVAGVDDPHLRRDRSPTSRASPTGPPPSASASPTHPNPAYWTPSRKTATTWSWPATPTAASYASPATAPSSPTANWTAPAPAAHHDGVPTCGSTCPPASARPRMPRSASPARPRPAF